MRVHRSVRLGPWCLLPVALVGAVAGCTQDFDQFLPTASGGAGALGGASTGATGGVGGAGTCASAADCDDQNPCTADSCGASGCESEALPDGLAPGYDDLPGDCVQDECVGGTLVAGAPDDTESPDDQESCTTDACAGGVPVFTPVRDGTECGAPGSGLECEAGECGGCTDPLQCPQPTVPACASATCEAETCGFDFVTSGTQAGAQVTGDCKTSVCDGAGNLTTVANPGDLPVDGNPCTSDVCTGQTPSNPPTASGTLCSGGVCNGASSCVECTTNGHCTPPETCVANACTCSDPTACAGLQCGNKVNQCGATVSCGNCPGGQVCGAIVPNICCAPDPNFCDGRCDTLQNNCLQNVDCGGCNGNETCIANVCVPNGGGGNGGGG